ncbi:hypothetical protein H0H92_009477 [Tricholoma furcatifolium]|nr:hypothetical protein H0H92_009477 [Tricholoma furcatifolium]
MIAATLAATVTVMGVQNPQVQSVTGLLIPSGTIRPIGTGANGETTYVVDVVESVVGHLEFSTGTADGVVPFTSLETLSHPTTIQETIVADATHLEIQGPIPTTANGFAAGVNEDCVLDGKTGSCVEEVVVVYPGSSSTSTAPFTTFTGSVIPIFTVVTANGSVHRFGLLYEARVGLGIVVLGMLSAWFLVL